MPAPDPAARRAVVAALTAAALSLSLSGCGGLTDVPTHMQVREGNNPENADTNVRFRTTYYFRTFDYCIDPTSKERSPVPQTDSVYRFVMTGKASALSKIHFESGVLHKSEIDPFGANVEFDENSGRFRYVSREETESRARQNETLDEIEGLLELRRRLQGPPPKEGEEPPAEDPLAKQVQDIIGKRLQSLGAHPDPAAATFDDKADKGKPGCPAGSVSQRGFQILGPEGWRTFDQDERLLMAMSSSGKPLLGAMRELAGRALQEKPTAAAALLPVMQERLRLVRAQRVLDNARTVGGSGDPGPLLESVLEAFDSEDGQGGTQ